MTVLSKLVAFRNEGNGYLVYVFKCLDPEIYSKTPYIMCVRYPNWQHEDISLGKEGFLTFEEVKGNNVFAYLTQIASNRFTYILNTEKNQRKIKSKLMQQAGYNATYNEQVDFEMKLRAEELGLNDEEITLDYDDSNQD